MRFKLLLQISAIDSIQVQHIITDVNKFHGLFKPVGQIACQYCSASTTTTTPVGVTDKSNAADNGILKRVLKKVGFTPNSKAV